VGMRHQLSWVVYGRGATESTLQSLTSAIQDLQQKVAALEDRVGAMDVRQLDEFDAVRREVARATDDLMSRVDALRQQVNRS
jgi:polyhydroxyalkanoate synthesis regulator phasin